MSVLCWSRGVDKVEKAHACTWKGRPRARTPPNLPVHVCVRVFVCVSECVSIPCPAAGCRFSCLGLYIRKRAPVSRTRTRRATWRGSKSETRMKSLFGEEEEWVGEGECQESRRGIC